jgi:hypothetical protein
MSLSTEGIGLGSLDRMALEFLSAVNGVADRM